MYEQAHQRRAVGRSTAPRSAAGSLAGLLALDLPTVDLDASLLDEALAIAVRFPGASVYDAAYHALALGVVASSLTADEAYFRRTRRLGGIELLCPRGIGAQSSAKRIRLGSSASNTGRWLIWNPSPFRGVRSTGAWHQVLQRPAAEVVAFLATQEDDIVVIRSQVARTARDAGV